MGLLVVGFGGQGRVRADPELRLRRGQGSWKAVCTFLKIDTAGDSARRELKTWVEQNNTELTGSA